MHEGHLHHTEVRTPIYLSVLLMVALQVAISDRLTVGPKYLLAGLELTLLFGAALAHSSGKPSLYHIKRFFSFLLLVIVTATNIASLILVVNDLVIGTTIPGHTLLLSALAIYLTNILIFGL